MIKYLFTFIICFSSYVLMAQEPVIIEGDLIPAFVTEGDNKLKKLSRNGIRIPMACVSFSVESVGKELGTVIETKMPFVVSNITFSVAENQMQNAEVSVKIYKIYEENLVNVIQIPLRQNIPITEDMLSFRIIPQQRIELESGKYFIGIRLEKTVAASEDKMIFPLYVKDSYARDSEKAPLRKFGCANIGLTVYGTKINK